VAAAHQSRGWPERLPEGASFRPQRLLGPRSAVSTRRRRPRRRSVTDRLACGIRVQPVIARSHGTLGEPTAHADSGPAAGTGARQSLAHASAGPTPQRRGRRSSRRAGLPAHRRAIEPARDLRRQPRQHGPRGDNVTRADQVCGDCLLEPGIQRTGLILAQVETNLTGTRGHARRSGHERNPPPQLVRRVLVRDSRLAELLGGNVESARRRSIRDSAKESQFVRRDQGRPRPALAELATEWPWNATVEDLTAARAHEPHESQIGIAGRTLEQPRRNDVDALP
jgi:hypothetical protein